MRRNVFNLTIYVEFFDIRTYPFIAFAFFIFIVVTKGLGKIVIAYFTSTLLLNLLFVQVCAVHSFDLKSA